MISFRTRTFSKVKDDTEYIYLNCVKCLYRCVTKTINIYNWSLYWLRSATRLEFSSYRNSV